MTLWLYYYCKGGDFLRLCEVENGAQQDSIVGGSASLTEALFKDITQRGVITVSNQKKRKNW